MVSKNLIKKLKPAHGEPVSKSKKDIVKK